VIVNDAFCCLGVLCDIFDPDEWTRDEDGGWSFVIPEAHDYPSGPTHQKTGLLPEQGRYLAEMNDGGKSFRRYSRLDRENVMTE